MIEHNNLENYTFPRPELITTLDCEVFGTLDKSELVEFLEKYKKYNFNEAVQNSSEINGFISILKSRYENFKNVFEDYRHNVSNHTTSISRNLQSFMKEFGHYTILLEQELNHSPIEDHRYRPILNLIELEIDPQFESSKFDIYKLEKDFFKPMILIFIQLRHDERIGPMLEHVRNCITEIRAIRLEKNYLDINFQNLKTSYAESLKSLPKIIEMLE